MSDPMTDNRLIDRGDKPRRGRTSILTLGLLLAIGVAAAIFWSVRDVATVEPRSEAVQATSEPGPPVAQIGTPSDTMQELARLIRQRAPERLASVE